MKNLQIKIITGFREDQHYSVPMEEAHKAYYLFLNPEMRGVFSTGLALIGKNIQAIEPDYHSSMGWNKSYLLGPDDYAELRSKGVETKLRDLMYTAKLIAQTEPNLINEPINLQISTSQREDGISSIKNFLDKPQNG